MQVRLGGAWSTPTEIKAMLDGSWKNTKAEYVKINGVWRQMVPPNAILLFNSLADIPAGDGAVATGLISSSYERVIRGGTPGTAFGATTHTKHSKTTPGCGVATTHPIFYSKGGLKRVYYYNVSTHTHSTGGASHEHANSGSNYGYATWGGIPVMGAGKVHKGAVLFRNASSSLAALSLMTSIYNKLVAISNSASAVKLRAESSHGHGSASSGTTPSYAAGYVSVTGRWENNYNIYSEHWHTGVSHDPSATIVPAYRTVMPYLVTAPIFFDEVPSGTFMFFISDTAIDGWSTTDLFNSRAMICSSSGGATGGSDSHSHSMSWARGIGGGPIANNPGRDGQAAGSKYSYYYIGDHTHTITDSHGAVAAVPPGINLNIKIKG
jgi:hypothetical protein